MHSVVGQLDFVRNYQRSLGMEKELQFLNGKKWFFYLEKNQISIGTPKENLMHIILKQKDGSVYFLLYETPIVLKMEEL
jgi:hypothetical protein